LAKFKVWNENELPHTEMFKGDKIVIPAKGFVVMDRDDAVAFRGAFVAPIINDGNADPRTFKKIRIEKIEDAAEVIKEPSTIRCQACSYETETSKDLLEHVKANHMDALTVDAVAEKEIEARKRGRPAKAS
jgi:hypothetical protein